jgi:hypothetical protein
MSKKRRKAEEQHDGDAFIRASEQRTGSHEDLSELLGEEFVRGVTGGDDVAEDARNAVSPEELGGPFVESGAGEEFGRTVSGLPDDEEEEREAELSAFPAAVGPLGVAGPDERTPRAPEEVLDDDEEQEEEEERQADAEVPSEVDAHSEALEPETEQSTAPKP